MELNLSRRDGMAIQTSIYRAEAKAEKLIESLEIDGRTLATNCISNLLESTNISADLIEFRNSEFVREMLDTKNLENKIKSLYNKELGTKTLDEAVQISVVKDEIFFKRPEEYTAKNLLKGLCEKYEISRNDDNKLVVVSEGKYSNKYLNELAHKCDTLKENLSDICSGVYPEYADYITETYKKLNLLNTLVDLL